MLATKVMRFPIDVILVCVRSERDKAAAMRFLDKAMQANGVSEKVTMDKSGADKAARDQLWPTIPWR